MKRSTLELLRCPICKRGPLLAEGDARVLRFGPITCGNCGANHALADGILDVLVGQKRSGKPSIANRALQRPVVARSYERGLRPLLARFPLDAEGERLLLEALLGLEGGEDVVLDLSCGTGQLARAMASSGATVIGVDSSAAMLEEAKHHKDESGAQVELIRADAHDLPLRDETMDSVLNAASLHLYEDPLGVLEEIHRVLRPGGKVVCTTLLQPKAHPFGPLETKVGVHRRTEADLRHLFDLAGFESFERILFPRWIVVRARRVDRTTSEP